MFVEVIRSNDVNLEKVLKQTNVVENHWKYTNYIQQNLTKFNNNMC